MFRKNLFFTLIYLFIPLLTVVGQEKIINPDISYVGAIKKYTIANIAVSGVDEYEDYITPEGYPNTRPTGRSIGEAFGLIPIIPTFGYTLKF